MIDAVFISDLHLHPDDAAITKRFNNFINWAGENTKSVYILGDFFHVWAGDDALDDWSRTIAQQLAKLAAKGVALYYMHGNRDFLLGPQFAQLARIKILVEPTVITLGGEKILLMHGDRYCTNDKGHQWLRRLTRNRFFPKLFLLLPFKVRAKLVYKVREHSASHRSKPASQLAVVPSSMLTHMEQMKVKTLIHGHTHQPGLSIHQHQGESYRQYVLSDWDDNPLLMCYDDSNGFEFERLLGE